MTSISFDQESPPKSFAIEPLVATAVQPFSDQTGEEWFAAAVKSLRRKNGVLDAPVVISRDGILVDGYHRCKALLLAGRKQLTAEQFVIRWDVDRSNALDAAVQLNTRRRHLTEEDKQRYALTLNREHGWSQGRIAKAFGVSQATVSRWLAKATPAGAEPVSSTGLDGRTRTYAPAAPKPEWKPKEAGDWRQPSGRAVKAVDGYIVALKRAYTDEPTPGYLNPLERAQIVERLEEAIYLTQQVLASLDPDGDLSSR